MFIGWPKWLLVARIVIDAALANNKHRSISIDRTGLAGYSGESKRLVGERNFITSA
jgi:hypothetical protein